MSVSRRGEAIFSTRLGRFLPREAVEPRGPIVLRSEPEDDLDNMSARLERDFPTQCKAITLPIVNIYEYFDHYDCHILGTGFLHKVLENINFRNFTSSRRVKELVDRWKGDKLANSNTMAAAQSLRDIFTEEEVEEYGEDILGEAFIEVGDLMRLDLDREAANAHHQREGLDRSVIRNDANCHTPLADPSAQPQRNSSAPQISRISYHTLPVPYIPAQRSNSALGIPSDEILKKISGRSTSQGQVAVGRKDRNSDPTDSRQQVPKQIFSSDTAAQPPRVLPAPVSYCPAPLGVGVAQRAIPAPIYQPQTIMQIPMAKKPPPMGFSNDARNLLKQPTGATTAPASLVPQAMYIPYQFDPTGAENHHPRDMGGLEPGVDSDHIQQPFGSYSAALPFNVNNGSNQAKFLTIEQRAAVPFGLSTGGRGQYRRFSSSQPQPAFYPPSAASAMGTMPYMMPPTMDPYRHLTPGQPSSQAAWSQDGGYSTPKTFSSAPGFPERQWPSQTGPQRNTYQAQRDPRRCNDRTLYVGWFPNYVDVETLRSFFARCGRILDILTPRTSTYGPQNDCNSYSFIQYENSSAAVEAVKVFHAKALDFLGGPSDQFLKVQPTDVSMDESYNREEVRTQGFSRSGGSPYKPHHRNGGKLYRGVGRRSDSSPSSYAGIPREHVHQENPARSAAMDRQLNLDGERTTEPMVVTMEMPPQIDPTMPPFDSLQHKVSVRLPSSGNFERQRRETKEFELKYQDKSTTMKLSPSMEQEGSRQQQASQDKSGNTGFTINPDDAGKKSKSPTKPRAENKSTASRRAKEEEPKLATPKIVAARAKLIPAQIEKRSENSAKQRTGERKRTAAQLQKSPESCVRPKPDVKKSSSDPSGKKPETFTKPRAEERIEPFEDSAKPSIAKSSLVNTVAVISALQPTFGPDGSAHVILEEVPSIEAGLKTLAAFPTSISAAPMQEAATAEQQDQPVSLPMSRVDSDSTKGSELGGPSPFMLTEPTTYAHSEQSDSSALEGQVLIAASTTKNLPPKPSHDLTEPEPRLVQQADVSSSSNLEILATVAGHCDYIGECKGSSFPPTPSMGTRNPPDPVSANRPLPLATETSKDHSHENSDPDTFSLKEPNPGTSAGGSKAIIKVPVAASTDKLTDRAVLTQAKAYSTTSDQIASSELVDPSKGPDLKHGQVIPPRSSLSVIPATPILTHMKKQRNPKSPKLATDNPYAASIPKILDTPLREESFSEGKGLCQSDLAGPCGEDPGHLKSLEHNQIGKVDIARDQKENDATFASVDTIPQTTKSAQDRQVPLKEQTMEQTEILPSINFTKTNENTMAKTKKKSKSKRSKSSTVSESTTMEPTSAASAPCTLKSLPEPETPFMMDETPPSLPPKANDNTKVVRLNRLPEERDEFLHQFSAGRKEYYLKKTEDYDPKLLQAMHHNGSNMAAVPSNFSGDDSPPNRAKLTETDQDVVNEARKSGYLEHCDATVDTPVDDSSCSVSLCQARNVFEGPGQHKTSDSQESPNTVGAPDESNAGQVQGVRKPLQEVEGEDLTSNDSFHKQMAEVEIAIQKKRRPRELTLPSPSKADPEQLLNHEEILSQLTPEAKSTFLNLHSNPSTAAAAQPSMPVTPIQVQHSTARNLSPQQMAILERLDTLERHQAAAQHVLEHGQHLESIVYRTKTLSPPQRREVAMPEAQSAGTSLPLSEVNDSLTKSPSKQDLHNLAEEMSKLTESSRGIVVNLIAQGVSPSPSSQDQPWSNEENIPPRPAHKKLPSYSEVAKSPPKTSAHLKSPPKRSAQLPSLQPGDTVEVTQMGMETQTSGIREGPSQTPFQAESRSPYTEGSWGREGPERPFTERRDRDGWSIVAHQLAHNNDMDPWGVPRGEKAWGSGSSR